MDVKPMLSDSFSDGQLLVDSNRTDEEIGQLVRMAMEASQGMPFTVIQSLGTVVFDDLKEAITKLMHTE